MMKISSSIRSSFPVRARRRQKGFVLISVLLIAILFFGLIELLMTESSEKMRESSRFRARIVSNILAENGAELAAAQMTDLSFNSDSLETDQGSMNGTYRRIGQDQFVIEASGTTSGVIQSRGIVTITGTIDGSSVRIDQTRHER